MPSEGQLAPRRERWTERQGEFIPNPRRVVYPVDHVTSQRAALAKFEAEVRIMVGAQLTNRLVDEACALEDKVRARARDDVHYMQLQAALQTFMADAIEVRHQFMNPEDNQPRSSW
jgi:hypothetical protein